MVIEMSRQMVLEARHARVESAHYIGALSDDGRQLTLVTIDPDDPWTAFRSMRRRMRRTVESAEISLFDSPSPVGHQAEIVELRPRRAG